MSTKPIVLATDGSPSAAEATLEAIALARALDAHLVVVSVDHPVSIGGGAFYGYGEIIAELRKAEHERTEEALSEACAAAKDAGVVCEPVHAADGAVAADEICHVASSRGALMIVIGTHGWSPIKRVLHGSVSTAVVHEAHCPVLVVPSGAAPEHAVEQLDLLVRAR
jgi:nucleotide-binding universal stress UspA family protein